MHSYVIKKLEPEEIYKWYEDWDNKANPLWVRAIYDDMKSGNRLIFVCAKYGKLMGEGELVLKHTDPDYSIPLKRIHLSRLIIKPDFMNQGAGGALVDYLFSYARSLGYEEMSVGVDLEDLSAKHLYEVKGFMEVNNEGEDEDGKYLKLLKKL